MSAAAYIIYFFLFAALLIEPHILKDHVAGLSASYVQSLSTVVIVVIAGLVYWLHERDITRREHEKSHLKGENLRSLNHLTDLSAELGLVNRRTTLVHIITTDFLAKINKGGKNKQALMRELLAVMVVSLSKTEWGMLRYVDTIKGRTVGEVTFAKNTDVLPPIVIGNKILVNRLKELKTELKPFPYRVFSTSDRSAIVKCYYIFPDVPGLEKNDPVIQNIVDQAQLLYKYLYNDTVYEGERW